MDPLLERARELLAEPGTPEEHLRALTRAWLEHIADHRDHMVVFNQERRTLERDRAWQHIRAARREFDRDGSGFVRPAADMVIAVRVAFVRQFPVGKAVVDFACRRLKLAIELDGGQHADNPADEERTRMIEAHGYRVIRFWNSDVLHNTDGVLQVIVQEIALARGE